MKSIVFKSLYAKNFLSIGNEPVNVEFKQGINVIVGFNKDKEDGRNGCGKTTLVDAFFYSLFGKPLRNIKKESLVNWITKKDCVVSIEFSVISSSNTDEYKLTRTIHPSRVQLIKNDIDVSQTISETGKNINDILGTNPDMFTQSIVMCLNEVEPFLSKTPAIKKKFIEDICRIEVFGLMSKFIKNDLDTATRAFNDDSEKADDIKSNISLYTNQQKEFNSKIESKTNTIKSKIKELNEEITFNDERIKEIEDKISTLENNVEDVNEIKKLIETLDVDIDDNNRLLSDIRGDIKSNQNDLKKQKELPENFCPLCNQIIPESNTREKNNKIAILEKAVLTFKITENTIERTIIDIKEQKNSLINKQDDIVKRNKIISEHKNTKSSLLKENQTNKKWIDQLEKDINDIQKETNISDDIINELDARLKVVQGSVDLLKNKISILETSKFIVSDEGVKNTIVKKMIHSLNGRLNYYLTKLDANCTCIFNEYFEETIKNNRGQECSYFNFSGGERKRIDLAMLFTFMDIRKTQSNIVVNVGIYDELLDTSLDDRGIECVLNVLKERADNSEAIYIISHKSEAIKHITGEIIYLEKENDITTRKNYV